MTRVRYVFSYLMYFLYRFTLNSMLVALVAHLLPLPWTTIEAQWVCFFSTFYLLYWMITYIRLREPQQRRKATNATLGQGHEHVWLRDAGISVNDKMEWNESIRLRGSMSDAVLYGTWLKTGDGTRKLLLRGTTPILRRSVGHEFIPIYLFKMDRRSWTWSMYPFRFQNSLV